MSDQLSRLGVDKKRVQMLAHTVCSINKHAIEMWRESLDLFCFVSTFKEAGITSPT